MKLLTLSNPKSRKGALMKKGRLYEIDKRTDEIIEIIEMCDPNRDDDVLCNLQAELETLIEELEVGLNDRNH